MIRRLLPFFLGTASGLGSFSHAQSLNENRVADVPQSLWNSDHSTPSESDVNLKSWSLDEKIGQLFMLGFRSDKQVKTIQPGGVVLFAWNMKDVDSTRALTERLKQLAKVNLKSPLFVATDHEGGQVLRLRKGLTNFPDAAAVGATQDPYLAFQVGKSMGQELTALGLNMNLAPVLDLGNARSFLQNRVWGEQGKPVAEMTTAFIRGLQASRILAVAKHFPGHGRSTQDSHFGLPKLKVSEAEIWREDLEPFREVTEAGVQAVMTAHVEIPAIDSVPASISKKFISGILREKIRFQGLVITDDLEMGGVTAWGNPGDVAVKALNAGSDMIMVIWSEKTQMQVFERLKRAVASGEFSEAALDEKVRRIVRVKRRFLDQGPDADENPYWRDNLRRPESLDLVDLISKKAVSWEGGDFHAIMRALSKNWKERWNIVLPSLGLQKEWRQFRPADSVYVVPRRSDDRTLKGFQERLEKALAAQGTLLVITGPRASSNEDSFQVIRRELSRRLDDTKATSTVIWAHQGSRPVEIRRDPGGLGIGLVSLFTSSKKGISVFTNLIKEGTAKSNALP